MKLTPTLPDARAASRGVDRAQDTPCQGPTLPLRPPRTQLQAVLGPVGGQLALHPAAPG